MLETPATAGTELWDGYDREVVDRVWTLAQIIPGNDAALWRKDEFGAWLKTFLPEFGPLESPPRVLDHADPKQSHLDGLCLSRAWCFRLLGYEELSAAHLAAGMPHVAGGDYAGEHWLATFAVLALTAEAPKSP